ncbi:hypothetical protein ACFWIQ_24825 [Kitasatospora sp. NPDC127059]|uniref:hypothetical protein n=1 Tax=unclassified Kitasatospora TaxID=2633591 RepID=UPI003656C47A
MLTVIPVPDGAWLDGHSYGLGLSSFELRCGTTVFGHGGVITGNWSYLYGTRDGSRAVATNVNGDRNRPPIDLFPELLDTALRPAA